MPLPEDLAHSVQGSPNTNAYTFGDFLTYIRSVLSEGIEEESALISANVEALINTGRLDTTLDKLTRRQPLDDDELALLKLEPDPKDSEGKLKLKHDPLGEIQRHFQEARQKAVDDYKGFSAEKQEAAVRAMGGTDKDVAAFRKAIEARDEELRDSPNERNRAELVGQLHDLIYGVAVALRKDRYPDKDIPPRQTR